MRTSEFSEAMDRATERKKDADRQAKIIRDESMGLAGQSRDTMVGLYGQTKTAADDTAKKNYQDSLTSTNDQYDTSEQLLRDAAQDARNRQDQEADRALAQSWISYREQQRKMPQQLKAQGITGGETESSMVRAQNAYGAARSNTETTRMNANAATNLAEQNQMAQAESERRAQLTQLGNELRSTLMQNQRDYNNGVISAEQAYQSTVAGIYSVYQQATSVIYSGWNSSMTSLDSEEIAYNKAAAAKASSDTPSYTPKETPSASYYLAAAKNLVMQGKGWQDVADYLYGTGAFTDAEISSIISSFGWGE